MACSGDDKPIYERDPDAIDFNYDLYRVLGRGNPWLLNDINRFFDDKNYFIIEHLERSPVADLMMLCRLFNVDNYPRTNKQALINFIWENDEVFSPMIIPDPK